MSGLPTAADGRGGDTRLCASRVCPPPRALTVERPRAAAGIHAVDLCRRRNARAARKQEARAAPGRTCLDDLPVLSDAERGVESDAAPEVECGVLDRENESRVRLDRIRHVQVEGRAAGRVGEEPFAHSFTTCTRDGAATQLVPLHCFWLTLHGKVACSYPMSEKSRRGRA